MRNSLRTIIVTVKVETANDSGVFESDQDYIPQAFFINYDGETHGETVHDEADDIARAIKKLI